MLKFKKRNNKIDAGGEQLLAHFPTKSQYAEAYRTLRTNLYFTMMEKELNVLVVSSALPSEGKTNTAANLAYTIAQTGKSVIMVDADLRKPGLTYRFNIEKADGFSNLIADIMGRYVQQGDLNDYSLKDIITFQVLQQRNSVISIIDDDNGVELLFHKGTLVDVYWKNRPEEKKLGNVLIRTNLLTEEEVRLALGHQKKSAHRLGDVLISLGFVDENEVRKILAMQVMEAFHVAVGMQKGTFSIQSVAEEELPSPVISGGVDYMKLFNEFMSSDNSFSFIKSKIDESILKTDEKNLHLLPCGTIPPNPSELIGSTGSYFLIKELKKRFDFVIIDTSPIIPASDALLISPVSDGMLLVVKVGTNKAVVQEATRRLKNSNANVLGVTLNQADMRKGSYYNKYGDYYGPYYGN